MLMQIKRYYKNKYIDNTLYECGFFIYKKTISHASNIKKTI